MPSGHTQMVLMVLFLARRYEKVLFYVFLPIICGLILSTVYLRYHYVIDLIGRCGIGHRVYDCRSFTIPMVESSNKRLRD